ncbi:MAG: helix-turn-helix domain-containing protein [Spirochaetaceae bacterium]
MKTIPSFNTLARHIFPKDRGKTLFHWEHHRVDTSTVFYHYHPEFELNLVDTPVARRMVGDDETPIAGQELILLSPNLPHRWVIAGRYAEFWVLAFSRDSIGHDLLAKRELAAVRNLLSSAERGIVFTEKALKIVAPRIKLLGTIEGVRRLVVFSEIMEALCEDAGMKPITSSEYHSSGVEAEYRLVAKVVERFTVGDALSGQVRPSLRDAAALAGMSVPSFTRLFRRVTGESFIVYINRIRVARSCVLLESSTIPIVDVANEVGFVNLSHFNRQFKRYTGVQPREYRQNRSGLFAEQRISV